MYGPDDPRSRLSGASPAADAVSAPPEFFDFGRTPPDEISARGSRTWWIRGQNFALAYSWAAEGEVFARRGQVDEYVVLLLGDGLSACVSAGLESSVVEGQALIVVPPGDSDVTLHGSGPVVRLLTCRSEDVLLRCRNDASYDEPHAHVAPFSAWPEPVDGRRIRSYRIEDHPLAPPRFGRILRCSTFMVNWFDPQFGPREPDALSPHSHADFEQCSLAVEGEYIHHIRTPWTTRASDWREDEHHRIGSPSAAIIPPPSVHTSQSVGQVRNHLIDIFCPPRADFSAQEGWVLNAGEYPVPRH